MTYSEYKLNDIEIPETKYHKMIKWLCIGIQTGVILYLFSIWKYLPDSVPMHYNNIGEADGYGGKWTVWITPAAMLLMYQFLTLIKHDRNYEIYCNIAFWIYKYMYRYS